MRRYYLAAAVPYSDGPWPTAAELRCTGCGHPFRHHEPCQRDGCDRITRAHTTGAPFVFIRLPFPFDEAQTEQCEQVAAYWHDCGYQLRPGGPAGPAADIIRLERVT